MTSFYKTSDKAIAFSNYPQWLRCFMLYTDVPYITTVHQEEFVSTAFLPESSGDSKDYKCGIPEAILTTTGVSLLEFHKTLYPDPENNTIVLHYPSNFKQHVYLHSVQLEDAKDKGDISVFAYTSQEDVSEQKPKTIYNASFIGRIELSYPVVLQEAEITVNKFGKVIIGYYIESIFYNNRPSDLIYTISYVPKVTMSLFNIHQLGEIPSQDVVLYNRHQSETNGRIEVFQSQLIIDAMVNTEYLIPPHDILTSIIVNAQKTGTDDPPIIAGIKIRNSEYGFTECGLFAPMDFVSRDGLVQFVGQDTLAFDFGAPVNMQEMFKYSIYIATNRPAQIMICYLDAPGYFIYDPSLWEEE